MRKSWKSILGRTADDIGVVLRNQIHPDLVTRMAWEQRERGGPYYYRSLRYGGTVYKAYFGAGEAARRLAEAYDEERLTREIARKREQEKIARLEDAAALVLEVCDAAGILTRAHLVASGYHRHNGEWRRARE